MKKIIILLILLFLSIGVYSQTDSVKNLKSDSLNFVIQKQNQFKLNKQDIFIKYKNSKDYKYRNFLWQIYISNFIQFINKK